ncbi:MAG: hypothetical protein OEW64_01705 [Gammaproteobacteria bacterium]|nr:hypothetical protein [Gammaproteobacteria bacterium]MDH5302795.1 hypothetical protein [Gammaproteobacteria bacterium]MDH5322355.1 hypothetical protein [Gammaproteobacteria bacterium]
MLPGILIGLSAAVLLLLGVLHLVYTFRGPKLLPRDPALQSAMQTVSPVISAETTMWKAWVGFNASHSMGAILFGLVYGYLAVCQPRLLFDSAYLLAVGFAMLAGFFLLGRRYWFSVPYRCITFALACYAAAILVSQFDPPA